MGYGAEESTTPAPVSRARRARRQLDESLNTEASADTQAADSTISANEETTTVSLEGDSPDVQTLELTGNNVDVLHTKYVLPDVIVVFGDDEVVQIFSVSSQ